MRTLPIAILAGVIVLIIVASMSLFTVAQTEQVLITQFGKPVRPIKKPGLHAKLPLIQSVISFDRRLLNYETPSEEVILGDQKRLIVDSFTMYRIDNPLLYYQSVGPVEDAILGRLNSIVSSSLRRVLGSNSLTDVLSIQRARIMSEIRVQVENEMKGFGLSIEDVRIRRADLPEENTQAILSRMQSERERVARQARAEGAETSTRIRADADRDRTVLLADARKQADQLRGKGDQEAIRIFAEAFEQDPKFFGAWRTMQAYKDAFASGASRLVLSPENEFLRYLRAAPDLTAP